MVYIVTFVNSFSNWNEANLFLRRRVFSFWIAYLNFSSFRM